LYDQLLFRPLLAWSRKFRAELGDDDDVRPWFLMVLQRARLFDLIQSGVLAINRGADFVLTPLFRPSGRLRQASATESLFERLYDIALLVAAGAALVWGVMFIREAVSLSESGWVFLIGLFTAIRVMVLIGLASLIWVPIGVWIGLRPKLADRAQPVVQFLAAFPANLFFPAAVVLIL